MLQPRPVRQTFITSFVGLVIVDKTICRAIVGGNSSIVLELWKDGLGQLLSKFHTPLIETVDVPDRTLRENFHFINGNQASKRSWGQLFEHERVGWTVSFKDFVRNEGGLFFLTFVGFVEFGFHSLSILSKCHGFSLGLRKKYTRNEFGVMQPAVDKTSKSAPQELTKKLLKRMGW